MTLVPDTPVRFEGFKPENFDRRFRGAVPARAALAWSLNVPAVRELREYGIPRFENRLRQWGMTTLDRSPGRLRADARPRRGGGRLVEVAALYAKLAQLASGAPGGGREVRLLRDEGEAPSKMREPRCGRRLPHAPGPDRGQPARRGRLLAEFQLVEVGGLEDGHELRAEGRLGRRA